MVETAYRAAVCPKLYLKLQKFGPGDIARYASYGVGAILLNFLKLEMNETMHFSFGMSYL